MMSSRILVYYDTALPICLATDTSPYGVRAVVSHIMQNDLEKPVAFALWSLAKELGADGEALPYMLGFVVIKLLNVTSMYTLAIMGKIHGTETLTSVGVFLNMKDYTLAWNW